MGHVDESGIFIPSDEDRDENDELQLFNLDWSEARDGQEDVKGEL